MTRNYKIILSSIGIGLVVSMMVLLQTTNQETKFHGDEQRFSIAVKSTSVKVDGDRLRLIGIAQTKNQKSEAVVISYKIKSSEEKEELLTQSFPKYLTLTGTLKIPEGKQNFNQFDYQTYLARNHIHWLLEADELDEAENTQVHRPIIYSIDHFRAAFFDLIDSRVQGKTGDYVKALLFADKRDMDDSTIENYKNLGIVHLLSISGLHVQFLIRLIKKSLLEVGLTKETTNVILLIILPIYAFLAGIGVSVFRAVMQTLLSIVSLLLKKPSCSLDNWALTLIVALMIQPYHVYSAGFQLSYLLSCMMIVLASHPNISALTRFKQVFYLNCAISLVSLPILVYHYFEFTWAVVFLNMIFLPLFSVIILPMLTVVFLVTFIFYQTNVSASILDISNSLLIILEKLINTISETSQFTIVVGRLSFFGMLMLAFGILAILLEKELTRKKHRYQLFILGSMCLLIGLFSERLSPIGKVMMIDVGQGDAFLIKEPYGRGNYMIDTGGNAEWLEKEEWTKRQKPYSVGRDVVIPVLKSHGVGHLNQLYLTHADADHIGAVEEIITEIKVDEVIATPQTFEDQRIKRLFSLFDQKGISLLPTYADSHNQIGSHLVPVYPKEKNHDRELNKNDDSLVLYGKIGRYHWLFTGDLESSGEDELLAMYPNLKIDILKVGHHGSLSSSQEKFLDILEPKIGWISSGKNNFYGHPHPEIISRLTDREIEIYRTDQKGSVIYKYYKFPFSNQIYDEIRQVNE